MNKCHHSKTNGNMCARVTDQESSYCWQHKKKNQREINGGGNHYKNSQKLRVPVFLATPTDLSPSSVRKITQVINSLIADAFALYVKTKNFHWHLYGSHFRDYHLLFDEQANEIFSGIDILAERVRKLGGITIKSISHIDRLKTIIDDEDEGISSHQMISRLLADNQLIAKNHRNAIYVCDNEGDTPTGNILQEMLDQTERRIWFLFELSQSHN